MHLDVRGTTFSCEVNGSGPTLLLVHGFPFDGRMWRHQAAAFAGSHRVVVPDLRGFGGSGPDVTTVPDIMTMDDYARDLADLLDALNLAEPVTLCGLSMGGYVVFAFARLFPDRLARLILCDTRPEADPPEKRDARNRLADDVLRDGTAKLVREMPLQLLSPTTLAERLDVTELVRAMIAAASPAGVAAASRGMAVRADSSGPLPSIAVPTLVLGGEDDAITPPAVMRSLADRLPRSDFATIPAAGHLSPLENPEPVNAAIRTFLAAT